MFKSKQDPSDAYASKLYASSLKPSVAVYEYTFVDGVEILTIALDYGANPGEAYWHMRLIAQ